VDLWIIVLSAVGLAALAAAAFIHRDLPAAIVGFSWERSCDIFTVQWVQGSSYWGPPRESRNHRSQKVRTTRPVTRWETRWEYVAGRPQTRQVARTEWVSETRTLHTYEVPKRRFSHTVRESGSSREAVAWPATTGHVGGRRERYTVVFEEPDGQRGTKNMSEESWRAMDEKAAYILSVTWYGWILRVRRTAAFHEA
jgi:hypothetical protein